MKLIRLTIFAILFLISSFAGFNSARGLDFGWDATSPVEQRNILIISTEDVTSSNNELKSIWLMIFYSDSPRIDLFPIFPMTGNGSESENIAFAESFNLKPNGEPTSKFWNQMKTLKTWWDGYVVLDETSIANLMVYYDGDVSMAFEKAKEYLDEIPLWFEDPQTAQSEQTEMIGVHCQRFTRSGDKVDLIPLIIGFSQHAYTDMTYAQLFGIWQTIQSKSHSLNCAFPSLMFAAD
jgi:hypothetical protein